MARIRSSALHMDGACKVVIEDGYQVVKMPDGTTIPKQVWSRVYSHHNERAHVIVKLYVNLEENTAFNKPNTQPSANTEQEKGYPTHPQARKE
jgi:hypothetical protein